MVSLLKKYFTGLLLIMCIGLFSVVFTGCGGSSDAPVVIPAKAWGTAELIEADTGNAEYPQIAFDPDGNAIAVWEQRDNNGIMCIYSNRYDSTTGWGTAEDVDTTSSNAFEPQIGIDSYGNAIVVWRQGTNNDIYSRRYTSGIGWGAAVSIENNDGNAGCPQVAVDPDGNAIAAWQQYDGTHSHYDIYSNRYDSGTGWSTAEDIDMTNSEAFGPQIAIDPDGNAIAVWQQSDGTIYSIYSNRYASGTGSWGTAELIENNNNSAFGPQIAIDPDGNAIAVWWQSDGTYYSIYSNRYDSTTESWGAAQDIDMTNSNAFAPQIAIDSYGNAIVVWQQYDGTIYSIYSNRYDSTTESWGAAKLIENSDLDAYEPQIAINSDGNAIAVWRQHDGTSYSIYSNRYTSSTGWGTAELIENNDSNADFPQVAIDPDGNAIAVWQQDDGTGTNTNNIYANRFE